MQPALRLLLGMPALISLGTPIPVIVLSGITGSYNYYRGGYIDIKLAPYLSISGIAGSVLGSLATGVINGDIILLITAVALAVTALRFILSIEKSAQNVSPPAKSSGRGAVAALLTGLIAGFLAGFLGLGGGFLLVPALSIIFKKDMKTSLGTSLLVIIAYSIPAAATHFLLGHVDLLLAALLAVGIIPGAYLGSRVAISLPEALLRKLFGIFLLLVSLYFAGFEISVLLK